MMNRKIINIRVVLIVILSSFTSVSFSQYSTGCDLKFVNHLVNIGDFKEALYLLDSTDCFMYQSDDSANYLRGWSKYSLKQLLPSSEDLLKVKPESEFYHKSHYFSGYNYAHTGNYEKAIETFSKIFNDTGNLASLKDFEIAGVYLLQGDTTMFENSFSKVNRNLYEISVPSDKFRQISTDLKNHKKKSPVIAGLLSGIVPGSGKFYSGKRGEAVSALIATTGLGLVTLENYRKNGLNNFKTIAFGTAFVFSYVANIYGAVVTVNIIETEYRDNVKNTILFNMHIPLRNTFDR